MHLDTLRVAILGCSRCGRLASYIREVAVRKTRRFQHWEYWGRPLPGFGDPQARLLITELPPGPGPDPGA